MLSSRIVSSLGIGNFGGMFLLFLMFSFIFEIVQIRLFIAGQIGKRNVCYHLFGTKFYKLGQLVVEI